MAGSRQHAGDARVPGGGWREHGSPTTVLVREFSRGARSALRGTEDLEVWGLAPVRAEPPGRLARERPGAAASLREGLEETVTVLDLGLKGALQKTMRSTNPIESLNGSVQRYTRNVKRWRGGSMIQRASMLKAASTASAATGTCRNSARLFSSVA